MKVSIGISNRHVHVTKEVLDKLFGSNYNLTCERFINQPGQFASGEFVDLKTEKGVIKHVRILGPCRNYTQIEISKTDAYQLGLNPPVRSSGDLENSEIVTLVGPKGEVVTNGCIIADRHIHLLPEQVKLYGLEGKNIVMVKLNGEKGGIITNVHLKVSEQSYFEMHLDTDDANAHLVKNGDIAEIL
jgi:putative phosphotransacetylase